MWISVDAEATILENIFQSRTKRFFTKNMDAQEHPYFYFSGYLDN